ncbi:class I SAM-dependent methyltransferase [Consotaella aegiceratis]|uniref:class I SAM-dependent methyltransferase n=1 Tax=Consotaella aegiceratis TaxID=3097961 RepID=UPI002F42A156
MKAIDPAGFEAKFRQNADPWNYAGSRFEAFKRGVLLQACGAGQRGRVLELACANGVTTMALRTRVLRIVGIDASPTAIEAARHRTHDCDRIRVEVGLLPHDMPRGPFDLIVVSELLYYLPERNLFQTLARLRTATAPGGRVVLLHHLLNFDDAAFRPWLAHAAARSILGEAMSLSLARRWGRFEVLAFDNPSRIRPGTPCDNRRNRSI